MSNVMKVKDDGGRLFNNIKAVARQLESLNGIVQNPGAEITEEELQEWLARWGAVENNLFKIRHDVSENLLSEDDK